MLLRVIVFYGLTWLFLGLLGGIQQETGLIPPEISLPQWAPGIAALLMLAIFRKDGFKITFFSKETPPTRYLLAALLPVGVGLVIFLIISLLKVESTVVPEVYDNLPLVLLWMPLGALGEELGWRGYLHKKMDSRLRGLISSLVVGLLWMLIHVHFFTQGPVFLVFLALLFISYSIVIYAVVQDTAFNVVLATVFHLAINLSNLLFLGVIYETSFMVVNSLVWMVVAVVVVLMKKDLFFASKG